MRDHRFHPTIYDQPRKVKEDKRKELRSFAIAALFLFSTIYVKVVHGDTIVQTIDKYNVYRLLTYQLVERVGDCNVFVNGFNEKMIVCPHGTEKESL